MQKAARSKELEGQASAIREDLQRCRANLQAMGAAGGAGNNWTVPTESSNWQDGKSSPEDLVAQEKNLQLRLEHVEKEVLSEQQKVDQSIAAKEEELRQSRLELQKVQSS